MQNTIILFACSFNKTIFSQVSLDFQRQINHIAARFPVNAFHAFVIAKTYPVDTKLKADMLDILLSFPRNIYCVYGIR